PAAKRRLPAGDAKAHRWSWTAAPALSLISSAVASPRARSRAVTATLAPIRASSRAVTLPIPCVAPVTRTVFPFMGRILPRRVRALRVHHRDQRGAVERQPVHAVLRLHVQRRSVGLPQHATHRRRDHAMTVWLAE